MLINTEHLLESLKAIKPACKKDASFKSMAEVIHFESKEGFLTITAGNEVRVYRARPIEVVEGAEEVEFFIQKKWVDPLISFLSVLKGDDATNRQEVSLGKHAVIFGSKAINLTMPLTILKDKKVEYPKAEYPKEELDRFFSQKYKNKITLAEGHIKKIKDSIKDTKKSDYNVLRLGTNVSLEVWNTNFKKEETEPFPIHDTSEVTEYVEKGRKGVDVNQLLTFYGAKKVLKADFILGDMFVSWSEDDDLVILAENPFGDKMAIATHLS